MKTCSQRLYLLKQLRHRGLFSQHLDTVFQSVMYSICYISLQCCDQGSIPDAEAPGFEAEAVAFETEAKTEAVDPQD